VFTARYALSPYIKQMRFVFKGVILFLLLSIKVGEGAGKTLEPSNKANFF
jgi:hypothetical protein